MSEITAVGLDLAKNVFVAFDASAIQVHASIASRQAVLRKKLRRDRVLTLVSHLQRCVVAMEACGAAHFAARALGSGAARLGSWAMRCGSSRPLTSNP